MHGQDLGRRLTHGGLQAAAAAEAVLWRLTGLVIDAATDLQRLLDAVRGPS